MAAPAIRAGARVGPYELLVPIGAGGMGEVWKARDTRLERVVAIKFSQAQFSERFEREARAIGALNHPNIAQIYDVGENSIVMEFVDGEPVRAPDNIRKLLDIAVQIADGLAAAHSAGFVHRDLKPDNILVTKSGRVKILDFGLAKQVTAAPDEATIAMTNPGTIMGTVAYMSPEQARGQDLDARSDQFSFGLILYELTSGKRAFQRASAAETMTAIIREEPEPLPASVPAPLRWTVRRLLAKDPEDRYASTKDVLGELRTLPARISEITAPSQPPAAALPRKWIWLGAAAFGLLAMVIVVMAFRAASASFQPDISRLRFTPFAIEADDEDDPVWSPDGRSIAYLARRGVETHLMVKTVEGGTPPVSLVKGSIYSPSWSGDGERIYYEDYAKPPGGIYSVARAGGTPALVFEAKAGFSSPAVSPDGKTLAMIGYDQTNGKPVHRIWLSSPPGAAPAAIGPALPCCVAPMQIAWSPDGSKILAQIPDSTSTERLWLVTLKGKWKRFLPVPAITNPGLAWLPDNRRVIASPVSEFGTDQGLHLLDTESEKLSPLLPRSTPLLSPSISPDGKRIAYVDGAAGFALAEIPLNGGPPTPLLPSHVDQYSVQWSPVKNEFAFVRAGDLIIRNRQGTTERVVASRRDFPTTWKTIPRFTWSEFSPDGQRIAYTCAGCESGGLSIWVSPVAGGALARVTPKGEGGFSASWSPDGEWIAYTYTGDNAARGLAKIRVGSGDKPVRLTSSCGSVVAWSPKGDQILCADRVDTLLVSPDGKQTRSLGGRVSAATWSRDGRSIYAIRIESIPNHLYRVDPVSGKWQALTELPSGFRATGVIGNAARLSVAPDEKSVAVTVYVHDGDIWILDGFEPPRSFWEWLWPLKR